jgi:uncharacterized protein (DUF3820 family)
MATSCTSLNWRRKRYLCTTDGCIAYDMTDGIHAAIAEEYFCECRLVFSHDLYARRMHNTVYNLKKVCMHCSSLGKYRGENVIDRPERYNLFRVKSCIFLAHDLGSPYTTYLPQSKISKYS